jgi:NADH-quinone oxidoreductase subunit N
VTELLHLLVPEIVLVVAALLVLGVDLTVMRRAALKARFAVGAAVACAGCVGAMLAIQMERPRASLFDGALVLDGQTQMIQIALLLMSVLVILVSANAEFTEHVAEYLALVLFATTSMLFLVSSQNLLMIFLALELLSLSLYVLAGFNKRSTRSAEAALKYFLFGALSAAFLLFGLSLVYGLSNSINLAQVGVALRSSGTGQGTGLEIDPLLAAALVMVAVGFGFKVAAAPFHLWAPDVYEGAPAGSASLIASSSKVAGFVIFYRVMTLRFLGAAGSAASGEYARGWVPMIGVLAAVSMVLGNLVAIRQRSVRRVLAYSAIAHVGYMLLALMSHTEQSFDALLYYALTYGLTTIGAFGVVSVVEEATGGDTLQHFAGLSRRAPVVSGCMFVFMLSLAGIPPLAGFFGKFYIFASAIASGPRPMGLLWLVVLAIAMSAVSLYYYLQVLKRIYIADPADDARGEIHVRAVTQLVLCIIAAAVVVLGCFPSLLLQWIAVGR